MKKKTNENVGGPPKQADTITEKEEEVLWSKGVVGSDTPDTLVDTILYLIGIHFALRVGQEHRDIHRGETSQFRWTNRKGFYNIQKMFPKLTKEG